MDLPPWYEDQGYQSSSAYGSEYHTEDDLLGDFSFRYGRHMLEEDALNEKSCMQVLKIWIDKADEDIVHLEEDILMLQCHQLAWDDEQWSRLCSGALREKIACLDLLIERLKKDDRVNELQSETEELPPRLHNFLKPLLESYLAKSKQTETEAGSIQTPAPAAAEPSNEKSEAKVGTIVLKTYGRKSKSTELEERRISLSQQEKSTVIRNSDASGETCTNKLSGKVMSTTSTVEGRRMLNLVHVKLEPVDSLVIDSSSVTSIENEKKRNNDNKAITEATIVQGSVRHEIKVTKEETGSQLSGTVEGIFLEPHTEASSKVQKARVYKRASNKSIPSTKPSVKMKEKSSKRTPEAVEDDDRSEQVKKPRMESEHQIQVQQKCKECQQVLQKPSSEKLMEQNHEIETSKIASEVAATLIVMPGEANLPPLNPQISKEREGLKSSVMKILKMENGASNSTAEEAMDGVKDSPVHSLPFIKSKEKLTVPDLRAIAKSRNLRHYYKLRKEELKTLLGLE